MSTVDACGVFLLAALLICVVGYLRERRKSSM